MMGPPITKPSQWYLLWGRGFFTQFLAADQEYPCRQKREVWEAFLGLRAGQATKEFVGLCLWGKLSVHARVFALSGTRLCPVCGIDESLEHALSECRFYTAIKHTLGVFWPEGEQGVLAPDIFLPETLELLLETVLVWLSKESFREFRWVVKQGAKPKLDLLLSTWIEVFALCI